MRKNVHSHSRQAFHEGRIDLFPERTRMILELLLRQTQPLTDRDVMRLLGFTDPNAVRPRLTELVDSGILYEVGATKDATTGKRVRLLALPSARPIQLSLL